MLWVAHTCVSGGGIVVVGCVNRDSGLVSWVRGREGRGETYLLEFPVSDCVLPIPYGIVHFFCQGAEEVLLNQRDVETFVAFECVEPLSTDPALVEE